MATEISAAVTRRTNDRSAGDQELESPATQVSKRLIIACPHCRTRFSLSPVALEGVAQPKFHCSKCDSLFEDTRFCSVEDVSHEPSHIQAQSDIEYNDSDDELNEEDQAEYEDEELNEEEYEDAEDDECDEEELEEEELDEEPEDINASPSNLESHRAQPVPHQPAAPMRLGEALSPSRHTPTACEPSFYADELSSSRTSHLSHSSHANALTRTGAVMSTPSPQVVGQHSSFREYANSQNQLLNQDHSQEPTGQSVRHQDTPTLSQVPLSFTGNLKTSSSLPETTSPYKKTQIPSGQQDQPFSSRWNQPLAARGPSAWTGLTTLSLPLLSMVAGVVVLAYSAITVPTVARALSTFAVTTPPKPPPATLRVEKTTLKKVTLESGETAYLIEGNVRNTGESTERDVLLEGLLFDKNGAPIVRARASAHPPLAQAQVQSLTPSMIQELQASSLRKQSTLAPKETSKFTIALFGDVVAKGLEGNEASQKRGISSESVEHAQFFSARVYSVRGR